MAGKEKLFDVVVYVVETRKVTNIVGKNLKRDTGHFNAERRMDTVWERLNDRHSVAIVPAGKYSVGDKITKKEAGQ